MSLEQSKLANGLTIVSHAMPEVETVSLGLWVGAGSRSEAPGEHGVAHFLEHMAFKGTARRSAQEIAEQIEAVGGELERGDRRRLHRLLCARAAQGHAARPRHSERYRRRAALRPHRACPRARRDPAGDRRRDGFARRHRLRPGAGGGLPEPAGRQVDPRHGEQRPPLQARRSRRLSFRALSRAEHGAGRGGRRRAWRAGGRGRAPARQL